MKQFVQNEALFYISKKYSIHLQNNFKNDIYYANTALNKKL